MITKELVGIHHNSYVIKVPILHTTLLFARGLLAIAGGFSSALNFTALLGSTYDGSKLNIEFI